jgi:pilus assembly protein CpaB
VSGARRKRRAAVLLALALACGGLAASRVQTRERQVEAAVGPLVPVVVTRADVAAGDRLKSQQLAVRQVPDRFAPRDALAVPRDVAGQRAAGAIAAGGYVTAGSLQSAATEPGQAAPGAPIRRGERSVDLAVAGGAALDEAAPGTRVDVIVTTEPRGGSAGGRTYLALQDVELLAARPADGDTGTGAGGPGAGGTASDGAATHAGTIATLRVTLKQAVFLTAAQSFAREIRLLVRAPGDKRAAPPLVVSAGGL